MHYYIDGYNLMFRMVRAGDDLKRERESVIASLSDKIEALNLEASLVFDAHYRLGIGSRTHLHNLEICFTDEGETADEFILKKIKASKNPRLETVVTSDNQLASHARRCLAHTMEIKEFLQFLDKKAQKKSDKMQRGESEGVKKRLSKLNIASPEHASKEGPVPSPGGSALESFDYYLYHFEKEFREAESHLPESSPPPKRKPTRKKKRRPPKAEDPALSEFERWLKLFESRLKEETED